VKDNKNPDIIEHTKNVEAWLKVHGFPIIKDENYFGKDIYNAMNSMLLAFAFRADRRIYFLMIIQTVIFGLIIWGIK
jgi:hypothetical protein